MISRQRAVSFLDSLFAGLTCQDHTANGLQIEGKGELERVVFTTDLSQEAIDQAAELKADMLVVHHGLIWGGLKTVRGANRNRLNTLLHSGINLYVAHLPLDLHPSLSHNNRIMKGLGLEPSGILAQYGLTAQFDLALSPEGLYRKLQTEFHFQPQVFGFGPKEIRRLGVSSGSCGLSLLEVAIESGLDALITGEAMGESMLFYPAAEAGIHVYFCGHTETECLGIQALNEAWNAEMAGVCEGVYLDALQVKEKVSSSQKFTVL